MSRLFLAALFISSVLLVPALAVDRSLVLYLPLDQGQGTVAEDASSYENNGAVIGDAQWIEGKTGQALEFVSGSYIDIPEIPQYDVTSEVSLLTWMKTSTVTSWARMIDKSQWQDTGFDLVLHLDIHNPRFEFFVNGTTSLVDATTVVDDNEWHFIAGTFGDKTLRIYVDGVQEGEAMSTGNVDINPNDWPIRIGAEASSAGGQQYLGALDEIAVFDRALSADEVLDIFTNGMASEFASQPQPQNEAVDVARDTLLTWKPGEFAAAHDVYFGTSSDDIGNADQANSLGVLVSQDQSTTSYDPGLLDFGQTYYWRVDEVSAAPDYAIFAGNVWSFTVEPLAYPIENVSATSNGASDPGISPNRTIDGSGLDSDDRHSIEAADMWAAQPAGDEPVYIQYEFDKVYKLHDLMVWNYNVAFELMLGFGFKDVTIETSVDGVDWTVLKDVVFAQATAQATYTANTILDLEGVSAQWVRLTANTGWGAMPMPQFGLSEVRFSYVPVQARQPQPADGATDVSFAALLDWRAGREAVSHEVSLGTDPEALAVIDTVADSQYNPGGLDLGLTYYWRITEVNDAEPVSAWEGDLWSFSTQEYIAIEDFEGYSDDTDAGQAIWQSWIDGYEIPTNGSQVGYLEAPFVEQTIVHGGKQSMPLFYDNGAASSSEAELALPAQNWSQAGVTTLVLQFYGSLDNGAGQMYVKINDTKVANAGPGGSVTMPLWKQWTIDLAATGANLNSVTKVTVGVEGSGSGVVYVDDLRLYRAAPAVAAPVDPGTAALAAHYAFGGDVADSSGNGYHGTSEDAPFFEAAPGDLGQAMSFDGVDDHVTLPIGTLISTLSDITIASWVNFSNAGGAWQRIFDFGSGTESYFMLTPRQDTAGPMTFAVKNTPVPEKRFVAPGTLASGWHHVAVVIDSATMNVDLYQDGVVVASDSTPLLPKDLGETTQNWLGRSQWPDATYNGLMADVRIYSQALSAGEVRYLAGDR